MKHLLKVICVLAAMLASMSAHAQNTLKATLLDKSNGEPVGYATVSITKKGETKPTKFVLSDASGLVSFVGVKAGTYTFKAELMGYKTYEKVIQVPAVKDLGEIAMVVDQTQLDAASVSAVGNSIIVKKDTIEINANAFKTTENDVLEDLLKKIPGMEVAEDGTITHNGQTISQIRIGGKTFFLDDPSLASKNLPAKIIDKVKVVNKKSEQAEFTGIDDGEETTILDLSIKKGMMNGTFGNISLGAGHDIPASGQTSSSGQTYTGDWRFQGAGFLGKFTDKTQISVVLNGNNTNNRGFNDLAGNMMGNMRGGGGMGGPMGGGAGGNRSGNGITTSYMGGANGSWTLFHDKMDLTGNYLYNNTTTDVEQSTDKTTYLSDYNLLSASDGYSHTNTGGHRAGLRIDHKFSDNTSILFEPQVNWGGGSFEQNSSTDTYRNTTDTQLNSSETKTSGSNKNVSTSGFALLRQRLGIPGRTLTLMARYSFSNNDLVGTNWSDTKSYYWDDDYSTRSSVTDSLINQSYTNNQKSSSLMGRATFTEPIGHSFYVEANYAYNWSRSTSNKETKDVATGLRNDMYSSDVVNTNNSQEIGVNVLYQTDKARAQVGASVIPTKTYNETSSYNSETKKYQTQTYDPGVIWRWSPQAMMMFDFSENSNLRMFYRGSSSQPSVNKLMPVPDNSDPLNVSFGNPYLNPYFSHNIRGDYRYNNKRKFSSVSIGFDGGMVQDPIVNNIWYGANGASYSMPFNGPSSGSANMNSFLNIPIGKSGNFTVSNMLRLSWSNSSSYVGTNIDMNTYETKGYYAFMEEFVPLFKDPDYFKEHITVNTVNSMTAVERLRLTYRKDNLELQGSARTRMTKSWYTIASNETTMTFNNQVRGSVNWTIEPAGLTLKSELNYNWYNGYTTAQSPEFVMDAEIQKLLFNNRVTVSLKGYDIFGQAKNLSVSDTSNYHTETMNNTLGRYIVLSVAFRFGTFDRSKMRGPGGMRGGPGGPGGGPMGPPR